MYNNLFTQAQLEQAEHDGLVRSRVHPDNDELWILNYTEKAAFDSVWNNVTLNCRGLIVDAFGNLIARPFPKFFNYGQAGCPVIELDDPATITDKMDGSLGILYRDPSTGKYAIATRGSFTSDQAIHATELYQRKYGDYVVPKGITMLFEIVYPENRIVCDYGDMDDLVFLGSVEIQSGDSWGPELIWEWPGPVTEVLPYKTMREALSADPRPGKEGVVVHDHIYGFRVKIKQEDYIALHRIVTGLNARSVWQAMLDDTVDELIEKIPDEFHDFIRGVEADITEQVDEAVLISNQTYDGILDTIGDNPSKKEFAMVAKDYGYSWALFNLFENKDIRSKWLQMYKPKHDYSPVKVSNDAD
jgi:putative RNA ligase